MKPTLILISLFFSTSLFAQKNFEGTITYFMIATGEKDTLQLHIDFGSNGIRIRPIEPRRNAEAREYILVNFDSGKVYTVNTNRKSYKAHKLSERTPATEVPPVKTFAGHTAIGQLYNEAGDNNFFGTLLSNTTIFYTAEKLIYTIPEKYYGNYELMMIQKDKIVLGGEIHATPGMIGIGRMRDDDGDSTARIVISIEAKEVLPAKFTSREFTLPEGFLRNKPYSYLSSEMYRDSLTVTDSAVMVAPAIDFSDTIASTAEQQIQKKKAQKIPSKQKPATKQNATRRKDN